MEITEQSPREPINYQFILYQIYTLLLSFDLSYQTWGFSVPMLRARTTLQRCATGGSILSPALPLCQLWPVRNLSCRRQRDITTDTSLSLVGYDTSVIGGTMALDSFVRDFDMTDVDTDTRNTIQANIVSTFQVSFSFDASLNF